MWKPRPCVACGEKATVTVACSDRMHGASSHFALVYCTYGSYRAMEGLGTWFLAWLLTTVLVTVFMTLLGTVLVTVLEDAPIHPCEA